MKMIGHDTPCINEQHLLAPAREALISF
jgi:hypothetical protein